MTLGIGSLIVEFHVLVAVGKWHNDGRNRAATIDLPFQKRPTAPRRLTAWLAPAITLRHLLDPTERPIALSSLSHGDDSV